MCDTLVAVPPATADGAVWLAKNSDRVPGEAQAVEHLLPRRAAPSGRVTATYTTVPDVERTAEVVLSRPAWMWGAEMGANAHGVAIANEAVFTKLPVADRGLLGMDLLRLALERATTAEEALEILTGLLAAHGQGGAACARDPRFRYHNAFVVADRREAWVLETADRFWAAEKVRGVRTISNVLSIGAEPDRLGPGTFEHARDRGWARRAKDFHFARAYGDPLYGALSGGAARQACTARTLAEPAGAIGLEVLARTLRSHAGRGVFDGLRMEMPCAHAAFYPTRHHGQTTGSMIARLADGAVWSWLTGTSSPCLSVLKPVALGLGRPLDLGPPPPARGADQESLWWRHERLHRAVLADWPARAARVEEERAALEARVAREVEAARAAGEAGVALAAELERAWAVHREVLPEWTRRVQAGPVRARWSPHRAWWAARSVEDGLEPGA